jgi:hypothetical protein
MTYEDQVSHLQAIINGIFLPQFAPLLQTQTPQFIVSPASELDQDHATALDKVTVCAGGPLSDPGLLSPLSSEKEEHTNQTSSEAEICFSFPQWCETHKSWGTATNPRSLTEALERDMDSYEHEYLEKHEAQTKLAKFRAFRKVLQRRPWSFYPTAVLGQRRQTLPLSGWLCVNFGDSHPQQNDYWYDKALASYTKYLREVATPDQWKEFQDNLDEKAKADRDAINGGG